MVITENTKKIIDQAKEKYYKESNFADAILILDNTIIENDDEYLYYEKAKILYDYGKYAKASDTIDKGLEKNSKRYFLLKLKSEFLLKEASKVDVSEALIILEKALGFIRSAKRYFAEDKESYQRDDTKGVTGFIYYLFKESELELLESNINNLISSYIALNKINKTESLIFNERKNIFELLGLFTALFAFIISGVNIAKDKSTLDGIIIIAALGLVLMTFLLAIHMIEYKPRRIKDLWWII